MTVVQASALRIPRYDQCPLYRGELCSARRQPANSRPCRPSTELDDAHAVADPAAGDLPPGNDREWLRRQLPAALTPSQILVVDAQAPPGVVNTVVAPTSNSRSRGSSAGKMSHLPSHSPPKPPFPRHFADRGERIRTSDRPAPSRVRYQAAPRPEGRVYRGTGGAPWLSEGEMQEVLAVPLPRARPAPGVPWSRAERVRQGAGQAGGRRRRVRIRGAGGALPGPVVHARPPHHPLRGGRLRLRPGGPGIGVARAGQLPVQRPLLDLDVPDRRTQGLRRARAAPPPPSPSRRCPPSTRLSRPGSTCSPRSRRSSPSSGSSPSPATWSACPWTRRHSPSTCPPARSNRACTARGHGSRRPWGGVGDGMSQKSHDDIARRLRERQRPALERLRADVMQRGPRRAAATADRGARSSCRF